jgi:hypothetical protein
MGITLETTQDSPTMLWQSWGAYFLSKNAGHAHPLERGLNRQGRERDLERDIPFNLMIETLIVS